MKNHSLLGFVLLRANAPKRFTIDDRLSDVIPNFPLLSWAEDYAAAARKRFLDKGLLAEDEATRLAGVLSEMLEAERIEFASRFHELQDARSIREQFLAGKSDWKCIAYGVPNSQIEALSVHCKESVQSGILSSLQKEMKFPSDIKTLGYDILNTEGGEFAHSFLSESKFGLIQSEIEATKLAASFADSGPWFPVAVAEVL